jgi:hypothetical protein
MKTENKSAIIVLTRRYESNDDYTQLIKRNESISKNLDNKKKFEVIIFHEGDISHSQQQFISQHTPSLKMKFIDVCEKGTAFRKEKETIEHYPPSRRFPVSYRHMCSFWFVDFWGYVEDYDYVVRIDEDCVILSNINTIFNKLKNYVVTCAAWGAAGSNNPDDNKVTCGLNEFTLNFFNLDSSKSRPQIPPYTNVITFNLKELRRNERLKDYITAIDKSDGIYIYRWGDHVLWGEALSYLYDSNDHLVDKSIVYFHGSHKTYVNSWRNLVVQSRNLLIPKSIRRRLKWQ